MALQTAANEAARLLREAEKTAKREGATQTGLVLTQLHTAAVAVYSAAVTQGVDLDWAGIAGPRTREGDPKPPPPKELPDGEGP